MNSHQKQFIKLVEQNSYGRRNHDVFVDFCEIAAIALSNAVDLAQFKGREARYLTIAKKYKKEELIRFSHMLACVVESLEVDIHDCLGELYMELGLGNAATGQFFTPFDVSYMMAKILGQNTDKIIEQKGYFRALDPAVGAGAMLMAKAKVLRDDKVNYQQVMHATGIDIDRCAVHMSYIHFTLLHIPAVVYHGNSLTNEYWEAWRTPAHILGFWEAKLRRGYVEEEAIKLFAELGDKPKDMPDELFEIVANTPKNTTKNNESQLALF